MRHGKDHQAIYDGLIQVARRWAKHSPAQAFAALLDYPESFYPWSLLSVVVLEWVEADLEAALSAIEGAEDLGLRQQLTAVALKGTDPVRALALLDAMPAQPDPTSYSSALATVFGEWANRDVEAATRRLSTVDQPSVRREIITAMIETMARGERPSAAFDWAWALEDNREQIEGLYQAVVAVSQVDPELAAQRLLEMEGGPKKQKAIEIVIQNWMRQSSGDALDWVRAHTEGNTRNKAVRRIAGDLAKIDPEQAAAILDETTNDIREDSLARTIAEHWGESDPRAAFEWGDGLNASDRKRALAGVASAWAARDPWEAAAFAESLSPEDAGYQSVREGLATAWAELDPEAAVEWAAALPGEGGREVYRSTVRRWASRDPRQAAAYVEALEDPGLREHMAKTVAGIWVGREPAAAAKRAEAWLDPVSNADTFGGLAEVWSQYDAMEASKWVGTLPEGAGRDAAIGALIENIAGADPAGAVAWAETISDPALRERWKTQLKE